MNNLACCKIGALIDRYRLDSSRPSGETVDEYLLSRWLGDEHRQSVGYRTLTEWFNKQLLKRTYDEVGRNTMGVRLESEYEALTGDDIVRMETIEDLESDGIDTQELLNDMISWSTMRNHLNDCLDERKEQKEATTDWELESVDIACGRTKDKVETALSSFRSKGVLEDDQELDVELQVQINCTKCPTRIPLDVALDRGYVCPDHGSKSIDDEKPTIEVSDRSTEGSPHWSMPVYSREVPSFGV